MHPSSHPQAFGGRRHCRPPLPCLSPLLPRLLLLLVVAVLLLLLCLSISPIRLPSPVTLPATFTRSSSGRSPHAHPRRASQSAFPTLDALPPGFSSMSSSSSAAAASSSTTTTTTSLSVLQRRMRACVGKAAETEAAASAIGGRRVPDGVRRGGVAVVTGATRGIGKGIAIGLAEIGMKVYITGRTVAEKDNPTREDGVGGSLEATKAMIEKAGGTCVPVRVDHSSDEEIRAFYERVASEEGHIDVLVNNAYSAVDSLADTIGTPFWEKPTEMWDEVNKVGLRSHYISTVLAAPLLIKSPRTNGTPLVVHVSSLGGLTYIFDVAYGVGKAAVDRMAGDMAEEFLPEGVSVVSLWPGLVKTEKMSSAIGKLAAASNLEGAESPVFVGRAVAALASSGNLMERTGTIQAVEDIATEFGFTDEEGKVPPSFRSVKALASAGGKTSPITNAIPQSIKLPWWLLKLFTKPMPRFSRPIVSPENGRRTDKNDD